MFSLTGNPVELAPQHGDTGLGIDVGGRNVFMPHLHPQPDLAAMPLTEGRITVGIDGGYVRSRDKRQSHYEVMAAKSVPADRSNRYLRLVHTRDTRPKRRLHEVLKEQGWQENQPVTFLRVTCGTAISVTAIV